MLKLAAIVGPTAIGKTEVSLIVAQKLKGEIISCDSMQIYKGMDIGTAKVGEEERKKVVHHMIDIVDPEVNYSVADYQKKVKELIRDINSRGRLPILVGGTGLYYQAVVDDYKFFPMPSKDEVRRRLEEMVNEKGLSWAYEYLKTVDPDYAALISSNDQKRIIRALEVYYLTGKPFSRFQTRDVSCYNLAAVGLYLERDELYRRIDQRVEEMIAKGLIEEVYALFKKGYDPSLNSMQALGYKQVWYYLSGFLTYEEMLREIKRETRHYAKRQYTWFKKDKRIMWINVKDYPSSAILAQKICAYIAGQLYKA
ncbi:tRNA dimethylallyltransferase [Thermosyntropha lipolytica DSM 11003]|uniref:tRNA dimethylallyltransferase n=1 Tax=Thermosyntropha lipolytica DSM 11003 TaxID=1123382 RepID=A0A1M5PLU7_9FIRM|nr:tRNA (adenosine(37)-N6)-dimethylallyltransferase MiaA [Thermosyntropha lipolytica]SHH02732.1 tRNA dimethylallyltransferase [Thermosyntropha lipolytica DSM 11003]